MARVEGHLYVEFDRQDLAAFERDVRDVVARLGPPEHWQPHLRAAKQAEYDCELARLTSNLRAVMRLVVR